MKEPYRIYIKFLPPYKKLTERANRKIQEKYNKNHSNQRTLILII